MTTWIGLTLVIIASLFVGAAIAFALVRTRAMPAIRTQVIDQFLRECASDARRHLTPEVLLRMRGGELQ